MVSVDRSKRCTLSFERLSSYKKFILDSAQESLETSFDAIPNASWRNKLAKQPLFF
ncbi:hypothetical protein CRENPOLYSF2_1420005 [Crenothrix polyspora]|uniref:Uncharacterized protein n=1 Tax=Crenothrix polyspora TaxID=360316 RepID=A0A1R4H1S9_9GAMM|nr:hypothetical protein CRENPOLYSF2_1420005 [Crenothrix polyspora]